MSANTPTQYGRLTALYELPSQGHLRPSIRRWWCRCSCGTEKSVSLMSLRAGTALSCGCYRNERIREVCLTHGQSKRVGAKPSPLYTVWASMIQRCCNPRARGYENYGGRGIRVVKRWRTSFAAFLSDMGPPPPGLSLDRIDNDGPYSPRNCRWATRKEQALNRRTTRQVQVPGLPRMPLVELASRYNVSASRLRYLSDSWGSVSAALAHLVQEQTAHG